MLLPVNLRIRARRTYAVWKNKQLPWGFLLTKTQCNHEGMPQTTRMWLRKGAWVSIKWINYKRKSCSTVRYCRRRMMRALNVNPHREYIHQSSCCWTHVGIARTLHAWTNRAHSQLSWNKEKSWCRAVHRKRFQQKNTPTTDTIFQCSYGEIFCFIPTAVYRHLTVLLQHESSWSKCRSTTKAAG